MSNIEEILFKKIFKNKKITVLHCVSSYPTKDIDLNLLSIKFLKQYNFEIGFQIIQMELLVVRWQLL